MKDQPIEIHDEDHHAYTYVTNDSPVATFEVSNVYADKTGVWGEVSVLYTWNNEHTYIFKHKRTNLLTDKRPGIEDLKDKEDMWDWDGWYEYAAHATVDAQRVAPDTLDLQPLEQDGTTRPFLVKPFILGRGVSLLFGAGGTGKSMVALAMALSIVTGRTIFGHKPAEMGNVLYLDYEDDPRTHGERMSALMKGAGIEQDDLKYKILYLKPTMSISKMRRNLLTLVRENQPRLIIVDSIGLARGGDATGSEDTIRMFANLNSLGTSVLGIDHMTKDDVRGGKMVTPYGSIYTVNSVRLAWSIRRTESSDDTNTYLNLIQTKRNNVPAHSGMGAHMKFVNTDFDFDGDTQPILTEVRFDMTDAYWDSDGGTLIDRAVEYLQQHGNATAPVIATELSVDTSVLSATFRRHADKEVRRVTTGNPVVWGLPE